ncbi:dienelactone hydrolase [Pediococcus parvulus]|uniref:Alpha/beta hydrolase n=1 Tax=Pediococcus parvulus TaxID=54062 RepID=A0AAP5TBP6_9LACO|nr:alpha/beta hydrolase [Pediococcus parvulus]MDV7694829.1 alpha/beta hydrolase [Pediococcus parvulus]OAD65019.1 dienelactone hydrolase [Pediococcus parvulus]
MENQFGLVYKDALKENVAGKVNIRTVAYEANGVKASANVYTPANYIEDGKDLYPAITVAHPNGGVKEQVAGLFAQKLAENGYIAVAADAAYQGASDGLPRNTDNPAYRTEDIRAMADFLESFPGVDNNRIGALGICVGGGYTIEAAKTDKRLKAIATISMFNSGRVRRNGFHDSQLDSIQDRLQDAAQARTKEKRGDEVEYIGELYTKPVILSEEQLSKIPAGLYRDGMIYYGNTHFHPNSTGRYTKSSLINLMAFDAEDHVDLIDQPLLMMAGSDADTRYMTDAVYKKATGTDDKELFLLDGASHIDTYWKEPYVTQETEKLVSFFGEKL